MAEMVLYKFAIAEDDIVTAAVVVRWDEPYRFEVAAVVAVHDGRDYFPVEASRPDDQRTDPASSATDESCESDESEWKFVATASSLIDIDSLSHRRCWSQHLWEEYRKQILSVGGREDNLEHNLMALGEVPVVQVFDTLSILLTENPCHFLIQYV